MGSRTGAMVSTEDETFDIGAALRGWVESVPSVTAERITAGSDAPTRHSTNRRLVAGVLIVAVVTAVGLLLPFGLIGNSGSDRVSGGVGGGAACDIPSVGSGPGFVTAPVDVVGLDLPAETSAFVTDGAPFGASGSVNLVISDPGVSLTVQQTRAVRGMNGFEVVALTRCHSVAELTRALAALEGGRTRLGSEAADLSISLDEYRGLVVVVGRPDPVQRLVDSAGVDQSLIDIRSIPG